MTTGSSIDIIARVKQEIPKRWFRFVAPYRDAILGGLADSAAWNYGLIIYARAQTRLSTAYGIWLDILAYDFLRSTLTRNGAADDTFRAVIRSIILQERVTRAGMINAVTALTSRQPFLFEPWNTFDTGAYGGAGAIGSAAVGYNFVGLVTGSAAGAGGVVQLQIGPGDAASVAQFTTGDTVTVANVGGTTEANGTWVIAIIGGNRINLIGTTWVHAWTSGGTVTDAIVTQPLRPPNQGLQYGSMGYGAGRGGYGNMALVGQVFMKVSRGSPSGIPNVDGYGGKLGGYGAGAIEYAGLSSELSGVTDAMIYQVINMTKPTGSTMWVQFWSTPIIGITSDTSIPLTDGSGNPLISG